MILLDEKTFLEKNWKSGFFYSEDRESVFELPDCSPTCNRHRLNQGETKSNADNPFEIGELLGQGGQSLVYYGKSCLKDLGKSC